MQKVGRVVLPLALLASLIGCSAEMKVVDAPKYRILFQKEDADVKVEYSIKTRIGGQIVLANFQAYVDGNPLPIKIEPGGQHELHGTLFHRLKDPTKDATVSFAILSNTSWTADGKDILRGAKRYDDVTFSN